ncbi:MAG TPA: hypothetical protein VIK11_04010 [Tepidiformaceae bacterium]
MYVVEQPEAIAGAIRTQFASSAPAAFEEPAKPAPRHRVATDPEQSDLTLYLVQVPQGWELRSWRGRGILYSDLADPLRLAQGWVEEGCGRMLITRSARA